ncbi:MAG TPA: efflux RND transporter permease subunit [Gemmataceae bacterium]|jgi:multidrug efflux pump|nr:efflux RND transporter permease subunit [Gemmataceae bacterium]
MGSFTRFFIGRPIFATVLSILITLGGSVAVFNLPVAQYPEITPPTVEVSAIYPGANANVVADTIAAPIEQQVNGVEDMLYMSSTCANDGSYTLTVTFKPGTDLNIAQVLVQNRVYLAQPVLPDLVKRRGVTVKKKAPNVLMIVNLYSPKEAEKKRSSLYLSNYATIQLRDELARLEGVGDITFLGQRDYSMRIWLDPEKMAVKQLSAAEVVHTVEQQNAQVAAGQVGQPPAPNGQAFQYTINTLGRLSDPDEFADMIVKSDDNGRFVRLKDVARIELGAIGYDQTCTLDGQESVALSIYQLPGSNAMETARRVRTKMEELKDRFPEGVSYAIVYDTTPFINESINEVFKTLRDAVILVALVMLVFLQSWRSALVPLAAVPVAIIGTFAAMSLVGFSLNNLTLFGLVLAVGIVVDDAIVVVEAVEHYIEEGLPPKEATGRAMDAVAGPVIAVGLVLTAVFIPCVFITGIVGQFFRQFAVTIAISTLISAFNSLTLSPALCALLLKPGEHGAKEPLPRVSFALIGGVFAYLYLARYLFPLFPDRETAPAALKPIVPYLAPVTAAICGALVGWIFRKWLNQTLGAAFQGFNAGFTAFTQGYLKIISVFLKLGVLVLVGYGFLLYLTGHVLATVPSGFIPPQDKGYLLVNVQLPDSASLGRTDQLMRQIEATARRAPGVRHTVTVSGQSILMGANSPNFATMYVMLDPFEDRLVADRSADAIAARLREDLAAEIVGAGIQVFGAPPVEGLGTAGGFRLVVESPGETNPKNIQAAAERVVDAARDDPTLEGVYTGFRADTPWLFLKIDRVAAQVHGVSIAEVFNALQVYFGSLYINDFNRFGRTWQVNVQAEGNFRQKADDLRKLQVKNDRGVMVPVGSFLSFREVTGPVMVQRYNLYPAAMVNAGPAPGVSSGDALANMGKAASMESMPGGTRSEWTELAFLQLQTGDTATRALILAVVLVFLVLAAQYESWSLPLAVILVVPMCLLGAGYGVLWSGQDVNIFTQVGFVVLVGLACKNAILIVEFGRTRRLAGVPRREAIMEACQLRLRPIVMTSVAFILGVLPLLLAEGAGAEMRRTLGTAVFWGMIGVTAFGIFLTPVFFDVIQWATERIRRLYVGD